MITDLHGSVSGAFDVSLMAVGSGRDRTGELFKSESGLDRLVFPVRCSYGTGGCRIVRGILLLRYAVALILGVPDLLTI